MKSLIIADVHANFAALEAIFDHESTWDEVLFLGDFVMAGPHPNEVIALLSTQPGVFLLGNHDREVLRADGGTTESDPHKQWVQWTRRMLTDENLRFLSEACVETCAIARGNRQIRLHHGDFDFESGSRLWPDSPLADFEAVARMYPEEHLFVAHSHIQFVRRFQDRLFLNPGSAGHVRLGKPLSCYAVLEDGEITRKAIPYDVQKTCDGMDALPLERDFIEMWKTSFRTGILASRYHIRDFAPLRAMPDVN